MKLKKYKKNINVNLETFVFLQESVKRKLDKQKFKIKYNHFWLVFYFKKRNVSKLTFHRKSNLLSFLIYFNNLYLYNIANRNNFTWTSYKFITHLRNMYKSIMLYTNIYKSTKVDYISNRSGLTPFLLLNPLILKHHFLKSVLAYPHEGPFLALTILL